MPRPPVGRHRVLQRVEEVLVELHGLRVAARGEQGLGGESAPLLHRVGQLRVGGAQFGSEGDQVPAFGEARVAAVLAGERGDVGREVLVEGGHLGPLLDQALVHLQDHVAAGVLGDVRYTCPVAEPAELGLVGVGVDLLAERLARPPRTPS